MQLSGGQIILECLIKHDIDTVFGYPGGNVLELYDALYDYQDKIKHIITSHEQGACHAADGFARVSGKTGVVIATSGPGATNLVTGIATAYMDSVPLVAITGNVPLSLLGRDSFQEIDITGITIPITKQNYIVKNIEDLEDIVNEAFFIASSGRKGPVLIDVPKNILATTTEYLGKPPRKHKHNPLDAEKIATAVNMIDKSNCPILLIGGGVISSQAMEEATLLAEKINAPVATTLMGIGFDSTHPLYLGFAGMHGHLATNLAIHNCDLLISVGTRFSDRVATNRENFAKNAKIIHIDIDNAEIDKNISTDCHILGDAKLALQALLDNVKTAQHPNWIIKTKQFIKKQLDASGQNTITQFFSQLESVCDADTTIVTDVGQHQMWTAQNYHFKRPRTFISSGGLGTMGFGLGAAIGATIHNKKKTYLITGDGSFHMNLNEMATAVKNNLPIVVIVINNHVLGMVRQLQKVFCQSKFIATSIDRQTDYVMLAKAFGGDGENVRNSAQIAPALQKAAKSTKPFIINFELSPDQNVLPMIKGGSSIDEVITKI